MNEKAIDRIRKLLEMTTDNGCTEAEAVTAAERVAAIMTENNIAMADIEACDQASPEYDFGELVDPTNAKVLHGTINATAVAIGYFTDTVAWRRGSTLCFYGATVDVEVALYFAHMFRNVSEMELRAARKASSATIKRASYLAGFGARVSARLRAIKHEQDGIARNSTGRDIVISKKRTVEENYREATGSKLPVPKRQPRKRDLESWVEGEKAGARVAIARGVGSTGEQQAALTA